MSRMNVLTDTPPPPLATTNNGGASSAVRAQCNYLGVWPY